MKLALWTANDKRVVVVVMLNPFELALEDPT
jgi:hypothetical protein